MVKCHQCGKQIEGYLMDEYVFKRYKDTKNGNTKTLYFCSWSCMRRYDYEKEIEDAKRRDRKNHRKSS